MHALVYIPKGGFASVLPTGHPQKYCKVECQYAVKLVRIDDALQHCK